MSSHYHAGNRAESVALWSLNSFLLVVLVFVWAQFFLVRSVLADECDLADYVQTPEGCSSSCAGFLYSWWCIETDDWTEERWVSYRQIDDGFPLTEVLVIPGGECFAAPGDDLRVRVRLVYDCADCCWSICGDLHHWIGNVRPIEAGPTPTLYGGGPPFSDPCPGGFDWFPQDVTLHSEDITWVSDSLGAVYTGFSLGPNGVRAPEDAQRSIGLFAKPRRNAGADLHFPTYRVRSCRGDVNGDNTVNYGDVLETLRVWGSDGRADWNNDGTVGLDDLLEVFAYWGDCNS